MATSSNSAERDAVPVYDRVTIGELPVGQGQIRIAGRDYTELTLHSIQSRIGIVLQTPHLFSGTIRDNIRYGRLDATDEEIETASQTAGAHAFVSKLESGYEENLLGSTIGGPASEH